MNGCLVCGNGKSGGEKICKMCGMVFDRGISYMSYEFCSDECRTFFIEISKKSPEMADREVVI